ncbi:egl_like_exo domain-containing protein [Brevipalpus obovatus]|uniref:egl_like_exo domain-containing protein n=1 Tax=Brevipalpus obovatus TaxID=246614 RepID=UPI003D9EF886
MDNSDYEHIRNLTLMFFLDRLMDKGQPRSLHDLSCQFGTRGFTKEMRQIAGGSQSGLRKFLSQYPSLFTIVEDQVYITNMVSEDSKKERRDYTKEAAEYFRRKLEQYGDAEVPIKSLFGHRSQAPPEIRYVSGQNVSEFRVFLCRCEDIFVISENYVVLRSVLERTGPNGEQLTIRRVPEEVSIDPILMQQLVALLESTVFSMCQNECANNVSLDALFSHMATHHSNNELWAKMASNTNDLCTLLKMNSKSFHAHSTWVSLTPERKEQLENIAINDNNNHISNKNNRSDESIGSIGNISLKNQNNSLHNHSNSNGSCVTREKEPSKLQANISANTNNSHNNINSANTSINLIRRTIQSNITADMQNNVTANNSSRLSQFSARSYSPNLSPSPISSPSRISSGSSFQQRIRSQIMKAIADNTSSVYRNGSSHNHGGNLSHNNHSSHHSIDSTLLRNTHIVSKIREADEIVNELIKNSAIVSADCGINLGTSGSVTLLAIAVLPMNTSSSQSSSTSAHNEPVSLSSSTSSHPSSLPQPLSTQSFTSPKIYIFDVLFDPNIMRGPIKRLLESPDVIKVFHDCRNDSAGLHFQFEISLQNVFDTQVAHAVLQQQNHGKPVYKSKFISLQALCESYASVPISPRKEAMKKSYRRDQKYWNHRPLTEDMIYSTIWDVYPLVPDIYINMSKEVRPEYHELLEQLNKEAIMAKIKPDEVRNSKRSRKIDMEVTYLKQKLYSTESKQVVLSNREIRLLRFIDMTDEIKAKVEGSQKVAKKLERLAKKQSDGQEGNHDSASDSEDSDANYNDYDQEYASNESHQSQECSSNEINLEENHLNSELSPDSGLSNPNSSSRTNSNNACCLCSCHQTTENQSTYIEDGQNERANPDTIKSSSSLNNQFFNEASTQTLSTGDVIVTKVFLPDWKGEDRSNGFDESLLES